MQNNTTNVVQTHYVVYMITNLVNGKIYVGKHKTNDLNDTYMGSGKLIIKAIEKYGIDNFKKEAEIVNEEFVARDDTYNIVTGGGGGYSNVVFYANRALNTKLRNDVEFKDRFSKAVSDGYHNMSEDNRNKVLSGCKLAGLKTQGNKYVYNDDLKQCIRIQGEQLQKYIDNGWKQGHKSYTKTYMRHPETNNKFLIDNKKIEEYLNDGWKLCESLPCIGRVHNRDKFEYMTHKFDMSNFITVYNIELQQSIRISPLDLDAFLQNGWNRGRGFVVMHKDQKRKSVYLWEVDKYIQDGWVR